MNLTGKYMKNLSESKPSLFFVPHSFHSASKRVVCFYYCLLLFSVRSKKFICHGNVDSVCKWQSGGRGYQSDKWQSSGRRSTCKCDPRWCALSASPGLSKVGHDLFGSGGTEICLDNCHSLSEKNAGGWTKAMTANGLFRLGSPVT